MQALATLSKRVDGLAIREDNKGDGGNNKSGGCGNNGGRGGGGGNHNTSGKNDKKLNNTNGGNDKWIYKKGMEYDTTCTYKKRQWFNKEWKLGKKN